MITRQEERVSVLAHRIGLRLNRMTELRQGHVYQLIEHDTLMPIFPGRPDDGATLAELEAWLEPVWD